MIDEAEKKAQKLLVDLGAAIRDLRKGKKISQRELADKAGISQPVLSRIEQGGFYSLRLLCLVADALEVKIEINFLSPVN